MVIDSDFSAVEEVFDDVEWEVHQGMIEVGDSDDNDAEEMEHTKTIPSL